MAMQLSNAYAFFRRNAGGIVGQNALTALHLARAEYHSLANDWVFAWEDDSDGDLGGHEYWCADARRKLDHSHEILSCVLRDASGKWLASLGGNIDVTRDYARVIEAELASEALSEIEQAARNDRESTRYNAF